jgi:hypothetical protein
MMAVRSLRAAPVSTAAGDAQVQPSAVLVASSQGVRRPDNARASRTRALLARRVGLAVAAATVVTAVHPQHFVPVLSGGGGAGGGAGGSGGGSGGSGGGHGRWFGAQAAFAESDYFDEEDDSRRGPQPSAGAPSSPEDEEKFLVEAVKASNLPTGPGIPSKVCASPVGSDLQSAPQTHADGALHCKLAARPPSLVCGYRLLCLRPLCLRPCLVRHD